MPPSPPVTPRRRVLVTGAAGFVGSHLADALLSRGYAVIGVDNFLGNYPRARKESNLAAARAHAGFSFYELDLATDPLDNLLAGVDAVFHLAARPGVRDSWGSRFDDYLTNNVLATQRLLEAARRGGKPPFIYASSSSVYGDADVLPVSEDAPLHPVSPYGASKLAAEDLVHLYAANYGLPYVILRFFTVYGPRQRPDMAIHKFVRAVLEGKTITFYGEDERRDFTYVGDVVRACIATLEKGAWGRIFNVASGRTVSLKDLVATIEKTTGARAAVVVGQKQRGDVKATQGDTAALREAVGYAPATPLEEGIAAQVAWLKNAPATAEAAAAEPPRRRCRFKLSVVIVNYNAGHVIERAIASCWAYPPAEGEMEIVVVDNASGDGSAETLASREDILYIGNRQNVGYAAANNLGIAASRGEFILLLNPDVEVSRGLFDGLIDYLEENADVGVVGPALLSPSHRVQESYRRFPNLIHLLGNRRSILYRLWPRNPLSRESFYLDLDMSRPAPVDFLAGAAMMFRRKLVDTIGPLDPKYFMYVEDADFCRRARDAGYFTYLLPGLTALHLWGESSSRHPYRMVFMHHISMMRYFRLHQPLQYALYLLLLPVVAIHVVFELMQARRRVRERRRRMAETARC